MKQRPDDWESKKPRRDDLLWKLFSLGAQFFDDRTRKALVMAREAAEDEDHDFIAAPHILLGILAAKAPEVNLMLRACGIDPRHLAGATRHHLRNREWESDPEVEAAKARTRFSAPGKPGRMGSELPYTATAKRTLELAMRETRDLRHRRHKCGFLLLGVMQADEPLVELASAAGFDLDRAREALTASLEGEAPEPPPAPEEPVWFIEVDPDSDTPIYEQIVSAVEEAVATRLLLPGEPLPTVRQLAEELGTAPGTVARAYKSARDSWNPADRRGARHARGEGG